MAAFSADPSTLRTLILQTGQGFYIPAYQREFTWAKDEINRLFEDLEHGITRAAEGQSTSTFLGSVILVSDRASVYPKNTDALPADVLHVVDGQQRLTTILTVFGILSQFIAEQMAFLEPKKSKGTTTSLDESLLNMLGERREELLNASAIQTYSGDGHYNMKPRLIRQTQDAWGNDAGSAKYESDIAWFLINLAHQRQQQKSHIAFTVPNDRPHLASVAQTITDRVSQIALGDTDCTVLSELHFLTDIGMADKLIGTQPDPIIDPLETLDKNQRGAARLLALASFLLNGVLVIDVKAPDEDYAFALFEPLNTTGHLLTALQTLKPLIVQSEGGSRPYQKSPSAKLFQTVEHRFPTSMPANRRTNESADLLIAFALTETGTKLSRTLLDQRRYLRSEFQSLVAKPDSITLSREFVGHLADTADLIYDV